MTLKAPQLLSRLHSEMDQDLVIHGQTASILLKHLEFQLVMSEPPGISLTDFFFPNISEQSRKEMWAWPWGSS